MCIVYDGGWSRIPVEYLYILAGNSFISIVNIFLTLRVGWQQFPEHKPPWVAFAETLHRCRGSSQN